MVKQMENSRNAAGIEQLEVQSPVIVKKRVAGQGGSAYENGHSINFFPAG